MLTIKYTDRSGKPIEASGPRAELYLQRVLTESALHRHRCLQCRKEMECDPAKCPQDGICKECQ